MSAIVARDHTLGGWATNRSASTCSMLGLGLRQILGARSGMCPPGVIHCGFSDYTMPRSAFHCHLVAESRRKQMLVRRVATGCVGCCGIKQPFSL